MLIYLLFWLLLAKKNGFICEVVQEELNIMAGIVIENKIFVCLILSINDRGGHIIFYKYTSEEMKNKSYLS